MIALTLSATLFSLAASASITFIPTFLCTSSLEGDNQASYKLPANRQRERSRFPNIPKHRAEAAVQYTKVVTVPEAVDQCISGCSFYSVANFLQAVNHDKGKKIISPGALIAKQKLLKFSESLTDGTPYGTSIKGGGLEVHNLIDTLKYGVFLESDYPSSPMLDTTTLLDDLNRLLGLYISKYPNGKIPFETKKMAIHTATQIVQNAYGKFPKTPLYHFDNWPKDTQILSYGFYANFSAERKLYSFPSLQIAEKTASNSIETWEAIFNEIRRAIDRGQPLLMNYLNNNSYIDKETGIISLDNETDVEAKNVGHAVLITGYRLNKHGNVDMLKIQNSHANSPVLNMEISFLEEMIFNLTTIIFNKN